MLHSETAGSGPDLFLLHGWGMNGAVWERTLAELAGDYRVTVVELPGHGCSPYGLDGSLGAWTGACLEAAPERAVWIGWSLGGILALAAALTAPKPMRALVAVSATPRFVQDSDWPQAMPTETLGRFQDALEHDPAATLERFLALQVRGGDRARPMLRQLRSILAQRPAPDPGALTDGLALIRETDLRSSLGGLSMPSLWLGGAGDELVPAGWMEQLPRQLPGARCQSVPGAAHLPFLSHPQRFIGSLRAFLQELP